jgi:hypothetical protein
LIETAHGKKTFAAGRRTAATSDKKGRRSKKNREGFAQWIQPGGKSPLIVLAGGGAICLGNRLGIWDALAAPESERSYGPLGI